MTDHSVRDPVPTGDSNPLGLKPSLGALHPHLRLHRRTLPALCTERYHAPCLPTRQGIGVPFGDGGSCRVPLCTYPVWEAVASGVQGSI
jgi:hypothetical protein